MKMEFRIKLNEEDLKEAIKDGSLLKLLDKCSYGGVKKEEPLEGQMVMPEVVSTAPVSTPIGEPIQMPELVPTAPPAQATELSTPITAPAPTNTVQYTQEELAIAATGVLDMGKMKELQEALKEFGVEALTLLPAEQYSAFAGKLRALGGKI